MTRAVIERSSEVKNHGGISEKRIPEFVALISDNLRDRGKPPIPPDVQREMVDAYTQHGVLSQEGAAPLNAWAEREAL